MSERKVLNKYYPPDFDPTKIPKLKLPKDRQYVVRLMAPFNMRCTTCGEYIYKGKKFNARKETVLGETYLGIMIFRFYIRCPRCISEITFKTDPENTDYTCENGATRNFQAHRMMAKQEEKAQQEKEEEEANNPMKALENRTKESKQEMDILEKLEELRDLNTRQANVDYGSLLEKYEVEEQNRKEREEKEDEDLVKSVFGGNSIQRRLNDSDSDEDSEKDRNEDTNTTTEQTSIGRKRATDILTEDTDEAKSSEPSSKKPKAVWDQSVGKLSNKALLSSLVKVKKNNNVNPSKPLVMTKTTTEKSTFSSDKTGTQPVGQADLQTGSKDGLTGSEDSQAGSKKGQTGSKDGQTGSKHASSSDANPLGLLGDYGSSSEESD